MNQNSLAQKICKSKSRSQDSLFFCLTNAFNKCQLQNSIWKYFAFGFQWKWQLVKGFASLCVHHPWLSPSVTRYKSQNVYKICPKMYTLEKWMILTHFQKLPNNVGNLGKIIVATSFEWLPKVQKSPNLVALLSSWLTLHYQKWYFCPDCQNWELFNSQ